MDLARKVQATVVHQPNAFIRLTEKETRLVISTCCWCGRRVASVDSKVLGIAERSHACATENAPGEHAAGIRENDR